MVQCARAPKTGRKNLAAAWLNNNNNRQTAGTNHQHEHRSDAERALTHAGLPRGAGRELSTLEWHTTPGSYPE